jgi:2-polyprenyl-3-methyl-5-hydroxy-6-metoxy-1,4-benzoquinol methylase
MHLIRRTTCRACRSASLTPAIDLGEQYLQGSFIKKGVTAPMRKVPMRLVRCNPLTDEKACGLLQTEYTVPPEMMYSSYWYRSGTNFTMTQHLQKLVLEAMTKWKTAHPSKDPTNVLDIGCNDGTLLEFYPYAVSTRWGIDPSNITAQVKDGKINVINDFFPSPRAISTFNSAGLSFDIVTAIAMFYDLEDPINFIYAVSLALSPSGIFIFEMSHLPAMLRLNSYDTICHEHIEYYSFAVIEKILKAGKMRAISVSENTINGGSIRVYAVKNEAPYNPDESVTKMRIAEFELNLDSDLPYSDFQKRADLHRADLRSLIHQAKERGERVHVYGASTKGNTLLQWCGLDYRFIEAAADRNPEKAGAKTPGTEIPIISESDSRKLRPDYYLVLPWHFREEFITREATTMKAGTKLIFPLPKIEIVQC